MADVFVGGIMIVLSFLTSYLVFGERHKKCYHCNSKL